MKIKSNIFDMLNTDDLPPAMAEEVRTKRVSRNDMRVLSLFDVKKTLSATEIMVGLYRAYRITKSCASIHALIHRMKKDGLIKSVSKGVYEKV